MYILATFVYAGLSWPYSHEKFEFSRALPHHRSMLSVSLVHVHFSHVRLCRPLAARQTRKNTNFLERSPSTSTVFWKKKHSSTGFARAAIRRLKVTETRYIIVTTDQQIEFDLRIKRNEVCLSLWIIESDKHWRWPLLLYSSHAQPVLRLDFCSTMNHKIAFMACT